MGTLFGPPEGVLSVIMVVGVTGDASSGTGSRI